ncbi:unknown [Prevotella sp. CAG:755]|nr:unknown [Prevotella sp. CAG:755]
MNYTKHITLNTDRLQLREMNLSDMDALSLILQDEKVCMRTMEHSTMKRQ